MQIKPNVSVMCFSDNDGGMELDAIKLAALLDETCEVTLFCRFGSFIHKRVESNKKISFVPIKFSSRTFSISMLFLVRNMLKEKKINNVIFFGASELKTLYFSFMNLGVNVVVRHGTTKSHQKRGILHRLVYSCVNHHVALSEHLLKNVKYIVPDDGVADYRIIRPSFKFNDEVMEHENSSKLKIIHVGRMAEGKGQLDAIRACSVLQKSGIDFSLDLLGAVGDDSYSLLLKKLIENSGYEDNVNLQGFVEDTPSFLRASDIFLFPSAGEGMPNAFIEAMHYGLVCISYDNTVFPEFLEMGFYVHLVKDSDVDELSNKLVQVVSSLDEEKRLSEKNMAMAADYFKVSRELSEWQEILV